MRTVESVRTMTITCRTCGRHGKQRGWSLFFNTWHNLPYNVGGIYQWVFRLSEGILYPMHDRSLHQDGLLRSTLVVNYNGMFYNSPILHSKQATTNCNSRFRGIYYYTMYIYCNSNFINMHPVDYVGCLLLAYYFFSLSPSPLSTPSTQKGPMVHSQVSIFKSFWIRVFFMYRYSWLLRH